MRKNNNNKQKKSLIFSTAVVITGCIATAVYVNQTMNTATDYKIDLTQLNGSPDTGNSILNDPEYSSGASLARVSGQDVVNEYPQENPSSGTGNNESTTSGVKDEKPQNDSANNVVSEPETGAEPEGKEENGINESGDKEVSSSSVVTQISDLSFSEEDGMGWPLSGNVILNYSMDSAVYFETLMQYKYNPAILIGAEQGDNVSAVARGQVVKIDESPQLGNYVVMNLGNGYEVTYGQLESLKVQEGTVVSRGQVIGNVAKTTKYYSVEGDHVYFMITKDGQPVDPLSLLQ
ncbi:MAG: M23 family metallopeptidase [Lachnospiraceae bacterium]|nr:M23 family metallopeptidase [Lachnospiraceae bacterium]